MTGRQTWETPWQGKGRGRRGAEREGPAQCPGAMISQMVAAFRDFVIRRKQT